MDSESGEGGPLARHIRRRRRQLGLSAREAARRAGIAQNTWAGAEKGTQRTAEYHYAGIETALRWAPESIDAILSGGEPSELPDAADEPAGDTAAVRQIRLILDSELAAGLSAETKLAMIRDVIARDADQDDEAPGQPQPRSASG